MNTTPPLASLKYLVLETTRRCNLRCIHCMVSEENNLGDYDARDLPLEVFHKLLPMLRKFKPTVQLSGHGETFLHPNFMEMLEEVIGVGCEATFQTNGTILPLRNVEKFVRLGVDAIVISIDGASPEVFDRIRRRASLEKIVGNIRLITETKKRLKTKRPHIGIEFAAMRQNIHELPAVVKMAGELGVENFQVAELAEYRMTQGQSLANDPLMAEWAPKAEVEARKYNINLILPPNIPGRQVVGADTKGGAVNPVSGTVSIAPPTPVTYKGLRKTCKEPWEKMFVQYDGSVRPCCVIGESYGDLSTQSFQEVWQGPKYQLLRESLLSDEPYAVCVRCPFYGWERVETPEPVTVAAYGFGTPTASTVTATGGFRGSWERLLRRLAGSSAGDVRLPDHQLERLLDRLHSPDSKAALEQILKGHQRLTDSCVALLEHGESLTHAIFVERAYRQLLGRDPDDQGSQGYTQALEKKQINRAEMIGLLLSSEEFQRLLQSRAFGEASPAVEISGIDAVSRQF